MKTMLITATLATALALPSVRADEMKMTMAAAKPAGPAAAANEAAMKTMMSAMNVRPSGNPDQDFVAMMLPHHAGAVDMAKIELRYGKDPELRTLAENIVKAQEEEIGTMKAWRAKNGK